MNDSTGDLFKIYTLLYFQIFSAYFLKRGTAWNHPKITWNHLKPAILHKLSYSQVAFVLIFHPKVCFGKFNSKNWSFSDWLKFGREVDCYMAISILIFINLKFFKLNEIWCRGTLLYAYYGLNVYFLIIIFIHIFGANLVTKSEVFQIDWNLVQGRLPYTYFDFNVCFFKIFVIYIFFWKIWLENLIIKSEVLQIKWNLVKGYIVYICLFWL